MLRQNALTTEHSDWLDVASDFGNIGARFNRAAGSMQNADGACRHPRVQMSRTDATRGHWEALAWHHCAGVPVVAVLGGKSTVGQSLISSKSSTSRQCSSLIWPVSENCECEPDAVMPVARTVQFDKRRTAGVATRADLRACSRRSVTSALAATSRRSCKRIDSSSDASNRQPDSQCSSARGCESEAQVSAPVIDAASCRAQARARSISPNTSGPSTSLT